MLRLLIQFTGGRDPDFVPGKDEEDQQTQGRVMNLDTV